jgi:hypothetical protein
MHVDEQQILSVSRELWSTQLGLELQPAADARTTAERTLSSCITVSGKWNGAIVLECSEAVARHAAAVLFEADGQTAEQSEIQDALNELADMVGKKVRGLLPEATKLSRAASVGTESPRSKSIDGMSGLSHLDLSCEGRPVRISLFEQEREPEPA